LFLVRIQISTPITASQIAITGSGGVGILAFEAGSGAGGPGGGGTISVCGCVPTSAPDSIESHIQALGVIGCDEGVEAVAAVELAASVAAAAAKQLIFLIIERIVVAPAAPRLLFRCPAKVEAIRAHVKHG
jgi:hypothetical protein